MKNYIKGGLVEGKKFDRKDISESALLEFDTAMEKLTKRISELIKEKDNEIPS